MKKPPYIQFYVNDFIAGTYMLSPTAKGIYISLLCYQWEHEQVPRDMGEISRICNCPRELIAQHWKEIENKFEPCSNDPSLVQNPRLRDEREKAWSKYKGQQERAEKARLTRQNTGSKRSSNVSSNVRTDLREKKHSKTGSGSGSGSISLSSKRKKDESLSVEDCLLVPVPDSLRSQGFTDAWSLWVKHKQASPKPWKSPSAVRSQLTRLSASPVEVLVPSIHEAISRDWEGIHILDDVKPKATKPDLKQPLF